MRHLRFVAVLCALALTACTDTGETQRLVDEVATLRKQVGDLEERVDSANQRIARLERRGSERTPAAMPSREPEQDRRPVAEPAAAQEGEGAAPPVDAAKFGQFLETEQGQAVFVAAMREYQARQAEDRRKRVVSALVEPFAKKAYLSQDQAERLSTLLEDSAQQVRDVWGSMREVEPEQRQQQVMANIQRSQEIRRQTEAKAAEFLSSAQYDLFLEEAGTLMGMPGRGRRPGGGDGGGSADR